jgi:hypothetical protein
MKQCITVNQILELNSEQQIAIAKILYPKKRWQEWIWKQASELMTIGKMIDILDGTNQDWCIGPESLDTGCKDGNGDVVYNECYMVDNGDGEIQFSEELCDALWQAVKEVLS